MCYILRGTGSLGLQAPVVAQSILRVKKTGVCITVREINWLPELFDEGRLVENPESIQQGKNR